MRQGITNQIYSFYDIKENLLGHPLLQNPVKIQDYYYDKEDKSLNLFLFLDVFTLTIMGSNNIILKSNKKIVFVGDNDEIQEIYNRLGDNIRAVGEENSKNPTTLRNTKGQIYEKDLTLLMQMFFVCKTYKDKIVPHELTIHNYTKELKLNDKFKRFLIDRKKSPLPFPGADLKVNALTAEN